MSLGQVLEGLCTKEMRSDRWLGCFLKWLMPWNERPRVAGHRTLIHPVLHPSLRQASAQYWGLRGERKQHQPPGSSWPGGRHRQTDENSVVVAVMWQSNPEVQLLGLQISAWPLRNCGLGQVTQPLRTSALRLRAWGDNYAYFMKFLRWLEKIMSLIFLPHRNNTVMCHLTTGMHSEKAIARRFRCASQRTLPQT